MITIRLLGGLGNQMFQYAYGLALRAKGYPVQYSNSALVEGTHREYSLGYFGSIPMGNPRGIPRLQEGDPQYDQLLSTVDPLTLIGYWQGEKYFEGVEDQVREFFKFPRPPGMGYFASKMWLAEQTDSVCLHVRRMDYLELQHFHGVLPIEYYRQALTEIPYAVNRHVFVISDDPVWCKENFPYDFDVITGTTKYEDMQLMAACKHAVIANSSFSWWGAWLGDTQKNRVVVAPAKWFADPSIPSAHIVPDRWIKI